MSKFYVAPCPKCGERDPLIEFAYRCPGYQRSIGNTGSPEARPDHQGEHFHITCSRCDWHWAKRVGDPDRRPAPAPFPGSE